MKTHVMTGLSTRYLNLNQRRKTMTLRVDMKYGYYDKDYNYTKEPSIVLFLGGFTNDTHVLSLRELKDALDNLKEKDDE